MYDGDFTGRTIIHYRTQIDSTTFRISGQFDEMFIGTYAGDHSVGALHTKGTFTIDENGAFHALARIVSGTCSWAGSTGSITYDGYQTNGGYVGQWVRPVVRPAADPTCNPVDWVPGVPPRTAARPQPSLSVPTSGQSAVRSLAGAVATRSLRPAAGPASAKSHTQNAKGATQSTTTAVRGGWVNDVSCVPLSAGQAVSGQAVNLECEGSASWNGDFTGRDVEHLHAVVQPSGRIDGTYEALFVGTYLGDHSRGALHEKGYFSVDEKGAFLARATITGGTCDWAGSSGSIAFDGYQTNGGYVGQWIRPVQRPAADATCIPADRLP